MMDFYNDLSSNGVFFFWIVAILFVILLVLLLVLFFKNRKLKKLINNVVKEDNKEEDIIVNNNVPVTKVEVKKEEPIINEEVKIEVKEEVKPVVEEFKPFEEEKIEEFKPIIEEKKEEVRPTIQREEPRIERPAVQESSAYKKNVLREMSRRMPISPIGIVRNDDYNKEEPSLDVREDMTSPLESMADNYDVSDNMRFASEIVEQMEKEIKPSNIELTDYERKQEEEAIISYDELSKVKDKLYNITEEEENDDFIDELKNFRLDLQ